MILNNKEPKFLDIENQFMSKWTKASNGQPTVLSIVKIIPSAVLTDKYEAYKQNIITSRPNLKAFGTGGPGNEQRRFHGTSQLCTFGLSSNSSPCIHKTCAVCGIIRQGWLINMAGSSTGCRFGPGAYFTSCSSKSHDYNVRSEQGLGSRVRSMFLARVVVGKGHIETTGSYSQRVAPNGHDSLIAKAGVTPKVNYDELIIFNDSAALPSYLVIYKY